MKELVERSRARYQAARARGERFIGDRADRPLIDVVRRLYERDREMAGAVVSSAVAFRLFLFFVPLTLFVVGLTGFASSVVDAAEVSDQVGVTGSLAEQIRVALSQPNQTRWAAVLVGLVGMATTGRVLSKVLVSAACVAWRLPVRAKASGRVVGAIVGLMVGVALLVVIVNLIRGHLGIGVASASFLGAFVVYVVLWLAASILLPRVTTDLGGLLPGATLVAATLAGMQAVGQLYLPDRVARASQLYGAIGVTVVTLGWFFILGRAIVVGMALNAVIHERFGRVSQFLFSLPVLRLLQRSSWIRRIFDLEPGGT